MSKQWIRIAAPAGIVALVLAGYAAYRCLGGTANTAASTRAAGPATATQPVAVPIVVTAASRRQFRQSLVVQGNVEARYFAMVSSRVEGTIEKLYVEEGDAVVAGQTRLFQVDALKLNKALEIAQQDEAVARCNLTERQAYVEQIEAEHRKIMLDRRRVDQMSKKGVATENEVDASQSALEQSQAMVKHAKALMDLAAQKLQQARAAVMMAQKNLSDSLVLAPLNGRICKRLAEPGEMTKPGQTILRIEDPSEVEVSAWLPGKHHPQITHGVTPMRIRIGGRDLGEFLVCYRSPTIDPCLRTFEAKCRMRDTSGLAVPGAMADIEIILQQREGLGVPTAAIIERAGRTAVFTANSGAASMIAVVAGLETDGWTEIVSGDLHEGDAVVCQGQFLLDEASNVVVREEK
ncbi:MAG: efflux RND transporter periplasmic adaptor subunit [Planctomycetaceae bacterium]|nr:efflux RND transporter periplasmic adaptor subunit [Planctomycetaceae bacterium]